MSRPEISSALLNEGGPLTKRPSPDVLRESVRLDAQKLMPPFLEMVKASRGIPANARKIRIK